MGLAAATTVVCGFSPCRIRTLGVVRTMPLASPFAPPILRPFLSAMAGADAPGRARAVVHVYNVEVAGTGRGRSYGAARRTARRLVNFGFVRGIRTPSLLVMSYIASSPPAPPVVEGYQWERNDMRPAIW